MQSLCFVVVFMTRTSIESSARPAVAARVLARGGSRPRRQRRRRRARLRSNRPRRRRRGPGLEVVILGEDAEGPSVSAVLVALVPAALAASHDGCSPFVSVLFS